MMLGIRHGKLDDAAELAAVSVFNK